MSRPNTPFKIVMAVPWLMLLFTAMLVLVGSLALYSASEGAWSPWAERHIVRACLGVVMIIVIAALPLRLIYDFSYAGLLGAVAVLAILPVIGVGTGAVRWIAIGGFNFQPSEPAKSALIIALARYFSTRQPDDISRISSYIIPILMLAIPFGLVVTQPDLGTALMLMLGGLAVIFSAGLPKRYIFLSLAGVLASIPVIWSQLYDYQKARVMTFLNPEADMLGAGYQITQSKIALGSGGLFGKGFLMGSQSQLNYLPEKQTDFVFTMIGEEFGLVGNLVVLGVYLAILGGIFRIGLSSENRFSRLVCVGIAMMIFSYVFVNIAMVTGLLPVVGAPLPLISYGGTAMLSVFAALGVVVNIALHRQVEDAELQ